MRTDDEINRAVALELGWRPHTASGDHWRRPGSHENIRLAFCTDYNAAAEIRQFLIRLPCIDEYITALAVVLRTSRYSLLLIEVWAMIAATPREQAEAFLRMRGKWVEEKI